MRLVSFKYFAFLFGGAVKPLSFYAKGGGLWLLRFGRFYTKAAPSDFGSCVDKSLSQRGRRL